MTVAVLILGAGASSRMRGGDKLLEEVEGEPLLRVLASRALEAGADVAVTLPEDAPARRAALDGLDLRILAVRDAASGMSASLRAGAAALAEAEAMIVLPGDMPGIEAGDLRLMIETYRADPSRPILRATGADGRPGHPVLFPQRLLPEFAGLTGDTGAAPILRAHGEEVRLLPLPGQRATTDLDTPEDWARWRGLSPR